MRNTRILDLKGQKFFKLTVIKFAEIRYYKSPKGKTVGRSYWKCKCDCGNTTIVRGSTLREGLTKSCGCALRDKLPKGEAAFNYVFTQYKNRAKKFNRSFKLSKKYFKQLVFSNCFYCGKEPSNHYRESNGYNGGIIYNGIDRKNNNKGYTKDNSVTCCWECNDMKSAMSFEHFKNKIKIIYNKLKEK